MAYALAFPRDVTQTVYSMRDFRLEQVNREGGTPSARAMKRTYFHRHCPPPTFHMEDGCIRDTSAWAHDSRWESGDPLLVTELPVNGAKIERAHQLLQFD